LYFNLLVEGLIKYFSIFYYIEFCLLTLLSNPGFALYNQELPSIILIAWGWM
jgi:hypothetical protein